LSLWSDRRLEAIRRRRTIRIEASDDAVVIDVPHLGGGGRAERSIEGRESPTLIDIPMLPLILHPVDGGDIPVTAGDKPAIIDASAIVLRVTGIVDRGEGPRIQQKSVRVITGVDVPPHDLPGIINTPCKRGQRARKSNVCKNASGKQICLGVFRT